MEPDLAPVRVFVDAVATLNPARLAGAVDPHVRLRALTPVGLIETNGVGEVVDAILGWFGRPDLLELEGWAVEDVGRRAHVSYRFLVHDEDGWSRVDHEGFVDVLGGRIAAIDLVCSGFERVEVIDLAAG